MRDITLGETIDFKFCTTEPDTGAPATLSGTPVVSAYVGNSTTQITAGITLTVDFDGVTGLNNVRVVATSGNGYTAGTDVSLVITTGTVDGNSAVGYVIENFTIGRGAAFTRLGAPAGASVSADIAAIEAQTDDIGAAGAGLTAVPWNAAWDAEVQSEVADALAAYDPPTHAELVSEINAVQSDIAGISAGSSPDVLVDTTIATLTNQTSFTLTAGSSDDNAYNGMAVIFTDQSTAAQKWVCFVSDYTGSTKTVTLESAPGFTIATGDEVAIMAAGGSSSSPIPASVGAADIRSAVGLASANLDTQLSAIQSDTDNIQTRLPAALVSGRMDVSVGAMASGVLTATAIASDAFTAAKFATDVTTEFQSGLATASAVSTLQTSVNTIDDLLDTEIAAIKADTAAILLDTGTDGVVVAAASKTGYALSAAGVDAIWDEAQSGHATTGTFGAYLDSAVSGVSTGGVSAAEIADAVWDEALSGHAGAGSAGEALSDAAAGDGLDAAGIRAAIGLASANLDTQLSTIDGVVDAILVDTAEIGAAGAGLTALATQASVNSIDDLLDTEVAAIKAKTDQLTFTVTGQVDANAESMNGGEIVGNGTSGNKWRGA